MKLNANWNVNSNALEAYIRDNKLSYAGICNAINERLDRVEFEMKGDAKYGKANPSKTGLKWTASQGFKATEKLDAYDAAARVYNLDKELAKLEKNWSHAVKIEFKPEAREIDWLMGFERAEKPAEVTPA